MKLFLCSRSLANPPMTEAFLQFVAGRTKVIIITTASAEYKENNENTIALKQKLENLNFEVDFLDVEFEDPALLRNAEIVVLAGGNPYYLLHHLKQSKADTILREIAAVGTPLMGISAGALVLSKDLAIIDCLTPKMNTVSLVDKSCLALVEEVFVPHYDRFILLELISKDKVDQFEAQCSDELIRLGEYQYVIYEEGERNLWGKYSSIAGL